MGAGDLLRYVQLRAPALRAASLRVLTGALRDFLRFLHLSGRGEERRVAAVPRPAPWPRGLLPQTLSKEQVRALLASFERTTRTGRRDYAMALCLTQFGLRVSEVAGLALEDIDGCRCTRLLCLLCGCMHARVKSFSRPRDTSSFLTVESNLPIPPSAVFSANWPAG